MKKNILLIGFNGFIGRNLYEYFSHFKDIYEVYAPLSASFDISNEHNVIELLSNKFYDVVINAAVYNPRTDHNKDSAKELDKNLRMYYNFERYQDLYGKMLYFGSGAEFDKSKDIHFIDENVIGNGIPNSDYGFYKYIINKSIQDSKNIYNLRIFGLFGKYENWRKTFISGACCKAMKNLPITIGQNVYFDYLYIDDFCRIVKWFVDNEPKYKSYNITSGKRIDLITIAEIVKCVSDKDLSVFICKEGLGKEYTANNERVLAELGSFNYTPIEEAIKSLYNWYQQHEEDIDLYSLLYQ